jgi:hypothetical protein
MLGLPGFRVVEVEEDRAEVVIRIETVARLEPCLGCGVIATAHDRMPVQYRDLALFGRPACVVEAALARRGAVVPDAHLDRDLPGVCAPVPVDRASRA